MQYIINNVFNNIFNNQQCMNHKDMKIITIKLFVNNLACITAYLANAQNIF